MNSVILAVLAGVFLILYMMRRRNRINKDAD